MSTAPESITQKSPEPSDAPAGIAGARFPVVGIGASAGGLAAFEDFFSAIPTTVDPGMAFVLVQHLAPDHKSILAELIQRCTHLPVFEVTDGIRVDQNCVYVIPPGYDMAYLNGTLHLLQPAAPHGHRLPINFFFRSLAQDQHERAIGIVLSGTGSDGSEGIRAIKAAGGMVMAQSTARAEFDGMPASAIATGLVDYTLSPAEMPARLMAHAGHSASLSPRTGTPPQGRGDAALGKVFVLLRAHTGHDFSEYKPSTVYRRIDRRMATHQIEGMDNYVRYLQQTPTEVEALFRDMLIGVTSFFRDPEAFLTLEQHIIPGLFENRTAGHPIRVWCPGCASGEEAYSIAILLQECMQARQENAKVQVFATDIDGRAVARARSGVYPLSIAENVSAERLARFFSLEADGNSYLARKLIRDMVIFSEQDVIKDPPFSRIDLLSCRNLLIYMNTALQSKLFTLFHYALNPGGTLFLGTSETPGELPNLFTARDHKAKLYQHSGDTAGYLDPGRLLPPLALPAPTRLEGRVPAPVKLPLRDFTEQAMLNLLAPVGVLVNRRGDILYQYGRSGAFLEPAPGVAGINNILKMAREGLQPGLGMALHTAIGSGKLARCPNLQVSIAGHVTPVTLIVSPLPTAPETLSGTPLFLVILEETAAPLAWAEDIPAGPRATAHIKALKQELRDKEEFLNMANEELESTIQELKSANEELQSVNEELQATNEELETSKEELLSLNEELATINGELQTKVVDLSRANNDMNNLLAGTGIATVFVDHELRILRFTPAATRIINLVDSDVGRPVGHIVANLVGYDRLQADARTVLDTLLPLEVDVQTTEAQWYTLRILPYRTLDNVVEGVVITFVDITEIVRTRVALREANELLRLAVVVRDAFDAITVQDLEGRTLAWNPGAVRMYGWSEAEALSMNVRERIPAPLRAKALLRTHQLSQAEILKPYKTQRITKDGLKVEVWMTATALVHEDGQMYAIATTERTRSARAERQKGVVND